MKNELTGSFVIQVFNFCTSRRNVWPSERIGQLLFPQTLLTLWVSDVFYLVSNSEWLVGRIARRSDSQLVGKPAGQMTISWRMRLIGSTGSMSGGG